MKSFTVEERRTTSFDGLAIEYRVMGQGLPVLVCNGFAGSWRAWAYQTGYLGDRYRFVFWDYRNLGSNGSSSAQVGSVVDHARDALAVADAERFGTFALMGWSMGVQVALEILRLAGPRVAAFVPINGVAAGGPKILFTPTADIRGALSPFLLRGLKTAIRITHPLTRRAVRWPETIPWAKRVGLTAATVDEELFQEVIQYFVDINMDTLGETVEVLRNHDATDLLEKINVPTLVITGEKDPFMPRGASADMVRQIPGSESMVVAGGSHYVTLEFPELVNLRIEKFFRERGYTAEIAST